MSGVPFFTTQSLAHRQVHTHTHTHTHIHTRTNMHTHMQRQAHTHTHTHTHTGYYCNDPNIRRFLSQEMLLKKCLHTATVTSADSLFPSLDMA